MPKTAVVTGAFSYTGHAVARSLLARGWRVRTLTNRTAPLQPLDGADAIDRAPLQFSDPDALVTFLRGADLLVNTYWIRYPHGGLRFDDAVGNSAVLLASAATAGVRRIVHLSISNPSADDALDYFRAKAQVETIVRGMGVSHAIVRPTLVAGPGDILVNNIAWCLRRFPLFAMPGSGAYRVQPVLVDDVGEIVVDAAEMRGDVTLDAAGPETLTFEALVATVGAAIGCRRRIVHVAPPVALGFVKILSMLTGDVVLTKQELTGLMEERLVSREPPRGTGRVTAWLAAHGERLGRRYASEVKRHFK